MIHCLVTLPPSAVLLHGVQSSGATWWRLGQDLVDLGWRVHALNLLAHGGRGWTGGGSLTITDLARDVLTQVPGPVDLVIGHSLGAIVALAAVGLQPGYASGVVVEDPPGPLGRRELSDVADDVKRSWHRAQADREAEVAAVLRDNPRWSPLDAAHAVDGCLQIDLEHVTNQLRTDQWDLPALVAACPVPLHLLAATDDSALMEPDRTVVPGLLPRERTSVIGTGHCIHRDRPAMWLHEVLAFAATLR